MWKKRDKGEATKAINGGRGGAGGSCRIGRRGGVVIGSKEAAEKVCSQGQTFHEISLVYGSTLASHHCGL